MKLHGSTNRVILLVLFVAAQSRILAAQRPPAGKRIHIEIPEKIVQELMKGFENQNQDGELPNEYKVRPESFIAQEIDLNRDGKPELYITGEDLSLCSPTGNCPVWLYGKQGSGYQLLLRSDGVQGIEPPNTFTKGFQDVMLRSHSSAYDSELRLYKFNGKLYRLVACFDRNYFYDGQVWKKPKVTSFNCN